MASKIDGTNGLIQNYIYLDGTGTTTPTILSGFNYTIPSGVQNVILNPSSTYAVGTIVLPANPADGMTVTMSTTQQITGFTVSASAGQSVSGGFSGTVFQAKTAVSYVYNSTKSTWYPFTAISPYILPAPSTSGNLLTSDGTIWNSTAASAIAAGIGVGQTWQAVVRLVATTYTNSTGKPIIVAPWFVLPLNSSAAITVAGIQAAYLTTGGAAGNNTQMNALVPAGATYVFAVTGSGSLNSCTELR